MKTNPTAGVTIRQTSKDGGVNISSGGNVRVSGKGSVVINGKVWIDGERCYPKSLIEELDGTYEKLLNLLDECIDNLSPAWLQDRLDVERDLARARRALDL
jgi:hypothetical protein